MTGSGCCLIKLLPFILFEKYIYILALEMASPREPAIVSAHFRAPYTENTAKFGVHDVHA